MSKIFVDKTIVSPYRTLAEVEKNHQVLDLSFSERFVDWWRDEDHYISVIVFGIVGFLFFGIILISMSDWSKDQAVINYGVAACNQDHYVKTEYPAVGLKKIVCLSANGEEKNIFEEINK